MNKNVKTFYFTYGPKCSDRLQIEQGTNIAPNEAYYLIYDKDSIIHHLVSKTDHTIVREAVLPEDHPSVLNVENLFPNADSKEISRGVYRSKVVILGEKFDLSEPSFYEKLPLKGFEIGLLKWAASAGFIKVVEYMVNTHGDSIFDKDFQLYKLGDITLLPKSTMILICNRIPNFDLNTMRILAGSAIKNNNLMALEYFLGLDPHVATPLAYNAVLHQRYNLLKYVVERGADITTDNTAVYKARHLSYDKFEAYLVKHGAKGESMYARLDRKTDVFAQRHPDVTATAGIIGCIGCIVIIFWVGFVVASSIDYVFRK